MLIVINELKTYPTYIYNKEIAERVKDRNGRYVRMITDGVET